VKNLQDPDSLRSFIYAIAIRLIKTELHRRKLRRWLFSDQSQALAGRGWRTMDMDSRDLVRKFHALLERLPTRDRLVFVLRRMESMTVEEIAAALGISDSTVKRSVARTSSRLSRWIHADPGLADVFDTGRWGR
jgi:RNA polymerase sigma-70 factor, ECF subfamily